MSRKWIVAVVAVLTVAAVIGIVNTAPERTDPEPESEEPESIFGTPAEIGREGDPANPRDRFGTAYEGVENRQERVIGGDPARLSGFTTWVDSAERIPASRYVDGYAGDYLKVHVRVFNRDEYPQEIGAAAFKVWNAVEGRRTADIVGVPVLDERVELESGETLEGNLYFYVADVSDVYIEFEGDPFFCCGDAMGVWRVGETI